MLYDPYSSMAYAKLLCYFFVIVASIPLDKDLAAQAYLFKSLQYYCHCII